MENTNNSLLIDKIKNGDIQAFQEFLEENFKKSKCIIQKQYRLSYHDLEDIIQITSLKAWKSIRNLKKINEPYNWFFSIFKNETIRFLVHKNEIEKNEISDLTFSEEIDFCKNDNIYHLTVLDQILNDTAKTFLEKKEDIEEYKRVIHYMMTKLKKNHKEIIELILVQEKSYKEASDILKIPLGSIMSRLHYAKLEAQKIINEYSKSINIELAILG
jgi:RNA polymerase sigma-70 factor (ECF subfamily)